MRGLVGWLIVHPTEKKLGKCLKSFLFVSPGFSFSFGERGSSASDNEITVAMATSEQLKKGTTIDNF